MVTAVNPLFGKEHSQALVNRNPFLSNNTLCIESYQKEGEKMTVITQVKQPLQD